MTKKKLECIIQALSDSLYVVAHNKIETEYVLNLIDKYETHYHQITGRYYSYKDRVPDTFPTKEWKQEMDNRFTKLKGWDDAL